MEAREDKPTRILGIQDAYVKWPAHPKSDGWYHRTRLEVDGRLRVAETPIYFEIIELNEIPFTQLAAKNPHLEENGDFLRYMFNWKADKASAFFMRFIYKGTAYQGHFGTLESLKVPEGVTEGTFSEKAFNSRIKEIIGLSPLSSMQFEDLSHLYNLHKLARGEAAYVPSRLGELRQLSNRTTALIHDNGTSAPEYAPWTIAPYRIHPGGALSATLLELKGLRKICTNILSQAEIEEVRNRIKILQDGLAIALAA